ncbi:MAG: ATPase, T2SS/T4P/T4SS family, partial [Planctomycetaceae bacterium]
MSVTAGSSAHTLQLEKVLKLALENAATEVRLVAGGPPRLLIDEQWRPLGKTPLTDDDVLAYMTAVMPAGGRPSGFTFSNAAGTFAGAMVEQNGGRVLRLQPTTAEAGAAPPPAAPVSADGPLELDLPTDAAAEEAADAGAADVYAMPTAAVGTVQIDKLLTAAVKNGVSDIHITSGLPPVFRIDGHMKPQATKVLTPDDTNGLMKAITPERCQAELAEKGGTDFGFAFKDLARFRVSVFKQRGQVAMVLRQIPNKLLTPEQLGLPEVCKKIATRPRGLFLVTGPTGSGK